MKRPIRYCSSCPGRCHWVDDTWVCDQCGNEWYPYAGPNYAEPASQLVRQQRRNRQTRTIITVYDLNAPNAPLDRCGGEGEMKDPRWLTMCEDHDNNVGHDILADAIAHVADPSLWCQGCQAKLESRVTAQVTQRSGLH